MSNYKKLFVLVTLLISAVSLSFFSITTLGNYEPDGNDYPYNDADTTVENEDYSLGESTILGDGSFDSLVTGVGDTTYGLTGTGSSNAVEWDATLPSYTFGAVDIELTPKYYSKWVMHGTASETSNYYQDYGLSGGDVYSKITLDPSKWQMKTDDSGSDCWKLDRDRDYSGCDSNSGRTTYGGSSRYDECGDGDWHDGDKNEVAIYGQKAWTESNSAGCYAKVENRVVIYDELDFDVDDNWTLRKIKITHAYHTEGTDCFCGGRKIEAKLQIETKSNGDYDLEYRYESTSSGNQKHCGPEDWSGTWDKMTYWDGSNVFYYSKSTQTYDIPDHSLDWWSHDGSGSRFKYEIDCYAKDDWLWKKSFVHILPTEFDVVYYIEWSEGSGAWFTAGTTTNIWDAKYRKRDGSWSSGTNGNDYTGEIVFAGDYNERCNGNFEVKTYEPSSVDEVEVWFDIRSNVWCDTEWGASITDVSLEWYDGLDWNTFSPSAWDISTPNLNAEDWYISGDGIKFEIRVASYSGGSGINGVSWSYTIDYHSINLTLYNCVTTSFSGSVDFQELYGRFIDETWNEFYSTNIFYEELKIEGTPISVDYELIAYDGNTLIYKMNCSFLDVIWDGDQTESLSFSWGADTESPTIVDYLQVNETLEYKPTLFNVTGSDLSSNVSNAYVVVMNKTSKFNTTYELTRSSYDSSADEFNFNDNLHLSRGNWSYWYLLLDSAGNWRTTANYTVNVTKASITIDVTEINNYAFSTTGNKAFFNISDTVSGDWKFYVDSYEIGNGLWIAPESEHFVSIDGYSIGLHPYLIFANNSLDRPSYYYSVFTVYQPPVFVLRPTNRTSIECSDVFNVTWSLIDDNARNYTIFRNSTIVAYNITWSSMELIKYEIDPCILKQDSLHVYKAVFQDYHNATVVDYLGIYVSSLPPNVEDAKGGYLYEDEDVNATWSVHEYCSANYSVYYWHVTFGWELYFQNTLVCGRVIQDAWVIIDGDDFPLVNHEEVTYVFKVIVYDRNGNNGTDEINVTMLPHPPELEDLGDGYYYADDENAKLEWHVSDANLKKYWITVNESDKEKEIKSGSLRSKGDSTDITLNLYDLELDPGLYEIRIYVEDEYGNIVEDKVIIENLGEQPGVEMNVGGLVAWLLVLFVAIVVPFSLRQARSDLWVDPNKRRNLIIGLVVGVGALLTMMSIFGYFPVTFNKAPELIAEYEATLGEYGVLILVLGIAGVTVAGIGIIWYLLRRRKIVR